MTVMAMVMTMDRRRRKLINQHASKSFDACIQPETDWRAKVDHAHDH